MEPLIQSLMTQYGMSRDLAERTAHNLSQEGGARDAYPKADYGTIGQKATPAIGRGRGGATRTAKDSGEGQPQPATPKEQPYDYEALKKHYPKDFHGTIDQLQRAYGPFPKRGYLSHANMGDDPILYLAQLKFEQRQGQQAQPKQQMVAKAKPSAPAEAPQVPESADELFAKPEPVRYSVGPGKSSYSASPVARTLVDKYHTSPEGAVALSDQMKQGARDYGVQGEAMGEVAARETRRLQLMKRYQDIVAAQQAGGAVSAAEAAWAAKVSQRAQEIRSAEIQTSARDAQAARETTDFNRRFDAEMERPDPPSSEQLAQEQARQSRQVQAVRGFRPGMALGPDAQSLVIPVQRQPNPHTVAGLMNSFGLDQGSATQLALRLEGVQ